MPSILVVTDAWEPQVNGVVRTLQTTATELRSLGYTVSFATPGGAHETLPCPTYPEIRLSLSPFRRVREALESVQPDHLHIATEGPLGWAARQLARQRGLNYTTAYHTQFPEYVRARTGIPIGWSVALLKRFHRHSQGILTPTPGMVDTLLDRGFRNPKLWTRGVNAEIFHRRPEIEAQQRAAGVPVFLYAGRVAVEKNIEAFLSLDLPGEKWVAGDGPQRHSLEARFPGVRWLGMLEPRTLAEIYCQASVFVFPSRTDTFGLVMAEAMACGTPVAAFPVTGPKDVVLEGTGVLHDDLRRACLEALELPRTLVAERASCYSWAAATAQFVRHLVPIS